MTNKTNGLVPPTNGHSPNTRFPPVPAPRVEPVAASPTPAPHYYPRAPLSQRTPTHSDCSVGREIRSLRRSQGRTQKELARAVGVTGAQLHRYETGSTRIAASRLIAIANALGVNGEALIAAGYDQPHSVVAPGAFPVAVQASDDIAELIELFGIITDGRHRSALIAVARMMALPYKRDNTSNEG